MTDLEQQELKEAKRLKNKARRRREPQSKRIRRNWLRKLKRAKS